MKSMSFSARLLRGLLVLAVWSAGMSVAQAEPTMAEIYATAQAGKLEQAQVMVQQVLVTHPESAKAHFVQSELYARQGNLPRAREALAAAEKRAPGLPFAKPEAVQALRTALSGSAPPATAVAAPIHYATPVPEPKSVAPPGNPSWLMPLVIAGGVLAVGYSLFRRRTPANPPVAPYAPAFGGGGGGLNGPQAFGAGTGVQPGYGQPGYAQPGYGQAAGSGMGGRIMGGVATGLAVGAGVVAAEAIGRNLMGNHEGASSRANDNFSGNDFRPADSNADMGGQNFGINDTSSWDDAGGGSGDWDN